MLKIGIKTSVNFIMKILKYFIAIWAAIAIYSLFSFFYGPKGISAYNQLQFEREQQIANLRNLALINEELEKNKNNLLFDHDTQLIHARMLGYAQENERFIRIVGLGNFQSIPATAGTVYNIKAPDYVLVRTIKIIALFVGFLIFAFLLSLEIIEAKTREG